MDDIKKFVTERLQMEYDLPKDVDLESFDYMENGYIDSVAMVSFVVEIEDEFNISFSDEELLDHKFRTVGGLCNMIMEKTGGK